MLGGIAAGFVAIAGLTGYSLKDFVGQEDSAAHHHDDNLNHHDHDHANHGRWSRDRRRRLQHVAAHHGVERALGPSRPRVPQVQHLGPDPMGSAAANSAARYEQRSANLRPTPCHTDSPSTDTPGRRGQSGTGTG